jgi:hypothetical protein
MTESEPIEDGFLARLPPERRGYAAITPRFSLGRQIITPTALDALDDAGLQVGPLLNRHAAGDWGDISDDDKAANDAALKDGGRIWSAYQTAGGRIWIITEEDRSSTCVMLPADY